MRGVVLALTVAAAFVFCAAHSSLGSSRSAEGGACFLPLIMGDMSGNEAVSSGDALWLLRRNAGLLVPLPPCSPEDVDCSGARSAADALKILRKVAGLPVSQTEPCVNIGDEIPP
jgi:hypothetical protein